ncbi:MarR family winged helix-turn-helix transcriptional regulator [Amycolatopsis nigrescens]|uniref:MarR family winged helix-turn-helix transcriptional regulator n=1 Tax=Amycolatopsis nigrescens TaxID=381445 RepID=UPI000477F488|nr:MarR family transcriptional regulator [Amycolatopsis nigrescens]
MNTRADRVDADPNLGVLAGRLLFSVQNELFRSLAAKGFDDLQPRHGAVMVYLDRAGIRASELSRLSGQHKQVVGTVIDELERLGYVERHPDPVDRRAKLVCPTARGLDQIRTADSIMSAIERRHSRALGRECYGRFKDVLHQVTKRQRRTAG